jgi:hypothetical protein
LLRRYRADGAEQVRVDIDELQQLGLHVVLDHLVEEDRIARHDVARHDASRLTKLLLEEFIHSRP